MIDLNSLPDMTEDDIKDEIRHLDSKIRACKHNDHFYDSDNYEALKSILEDELKSRE